MEDSPKDVTLPYISFVSLNLKVFEIFFEPNGQSYITRIGEYSIMLLTISMQLFTELVCLIFVVEKPIEYDDKSNFIRHSLHSFTGPNRHLYNVVYNANSQSNITIEAGRIFVTKFLGNDFHKYFV